MDAGSAERCLPAVYLQMGGSMYVVPLEPAQLYEALRLRNRKWLPCPTSDSFGFEFLALLALKPAKLTLSQWKIMYLSCIEPFEN